MDLALLSTVSQLPLKDGKLVLCEKCVCSGKQCASVKTLGTIRSLRMAWHSAVLWDAATVAILVDHEKYPDTVRAYVCTMHTQRFLYYVNKQKSAAPSASDTTNSTKPVQDEMNKLDEEDKAAKKTYEAVVENNNRKRKVHLMVSIADLRDEICRRKVLRDDALAKAKKLDDEAQELVKDLKSTQELLAKC